MIDLNGQPAYLFAQDLHALADKIQNGTLVPGDMAFTTNYGRNALNGDLTAESVTMTFTLHRSRGDTTAG